MYKIAAVCVMLVSAGSASAAGFVNNFDGENGGASALNYTGLVNPTVTSGAVDLIASGGFGITCAGGAGSCIDLDGTMNAGGTLTSATYGFGAGDTVTFSFDLSGNQRNGTSDSFFAKFNFGGNTLITSSSTGGAFGNFVVFTNIVASSISTSSAVGGTSPFASYSVSFVAGAAGTVQASLGTLSNDNVGPVVDNLALSITAVPEPASWALMIAGFGLVGGALRRGRTLATA